MKGRRRVIFSFVLNCGTVIGPETCLFGPCGRRQLSVPPIRAHRDQKALEIPTSSCPVSPRGLVNLVVAYSGSRHHQHHL
ncbi:hypothetical protein OJAV_G00195390 [Oryzias javanicus]|uniref:Uncharacterized protein n=1 Tax=Oryzias javanicus TaxID=123683 RepID=A0A3S2M223_ORYJA|nr:hypothetical protein OJAV_G00195390 [Oryzias javanicus]